MEEDLVTLKKLKQGVFDYIKFRLGGQMVDVELDPEHYENALSRAVTVFRQRSSASVEESYAFLSTQKDVQIYTMPEEIQTIRKIWRRSLGDLGNGGSQYDPFSQGYLNMYILNAGRTGGLLSYELFTDYQFQVDRMFGGQIDFNFNSVTKKLTLIRRPYSDMETLLLWTYNLKPLCQLLTDVKTSSFITEYAYCIAKHTLGEAREKFSTIIGPGGGVSLNGAALKAEALAEIEKLHEDIKNNVNGETPFGIIVG